MLNTAQDVLKKYYGYDEFRAGQKAIIESILSRKDTLGIMPTGGGKSICYQVPAILFEGVTFVISPLISLMKDQVDALRSIGITATFINSSLDPQEVRTRMNDTEEGKYKLIYLAPERLESSAFRKWMNTLPIALIAIDEAHCVSQWGHDFRPSYRSMAIHLTQLDERPVLAAFTATATQEVAADIVNLLSFNGKNIHKTGLNRENLTFSLVRGEDKRTFVSNYIEANPTQAGIVYAATRKEVDQLYEFLRKKGYAVGRYHAGLNEEDRKHSQEQFLYDDIRVMVATNAFGMGIDKSNVRYVIHYHLPKTMEAYYQEAGRAGRDGEPSECTLLFQPQDTQLPKFFIDQADLTPERKSHEYDKLQKMVDFCHTQQCLRNVIVGYFGEQMEDECGTCSNCRDDSEEVDMTVEAQKIFSCIKRMNERFGITMVAQVLKGSQSKRIMQFGFDQLSTYGLMRDYTRKSIAGVMNRLVAEGYLELTGGQYPVVRLKPKAKDVLLGKEKVFQKIRKRQQSITADNHLFEELRRLRKNLSEQENVPPYVIFPDSTLREMSRYYPLDKEAMLATKGVGQAKWGRYGSVFLDVIRTYVEEHNIEVTKHRLITKTLAQSQSPREQILAPSNKKGSHLVSYDMFREGKTVDEISQTRGLSPFTIEEHLFKAGRQGYELDWNTLIPQEYEELILQKIETLGAQKLKPLKEDLPEEVEYSAIKAVIIKHKL